MQELFRALLLGFELTRALAHEIVEMSILLLKPAVVPLHRHEHDCKESGDRDRDGVCDDERGRSPFAPSDLVRSSEILRDAQEWIGIQQRQHDRDIGQGVSGSQQEHGFDDKQEEQRHGMCFDAPAGVEGTEEIDRERQQGQVDRKCFPASCKQCRRHENARQNDDVVGRIGAARKVERDERQLAHDRNGNQEQEQTRLDAFDRAFATLEQRQEGGSNLRDAPLVGLFHGR